MCIAIHHQEDHGAGVGPPTPRATSSSPPAASFETFETAASLSVVVTEELLKRKNDELHALQSRLLSVPRSERRGLQSGVRALDAQIKAMQTDFAQSGEIQKSAVALAASLATDDPDAVATSLQRLVSTPMRLAQHDEVALCYLIGASDGVVASMREHPAHAGVMKGGCEALCHIFAGLHAMDNGDTLAQQLSSAEVGQVVIAGMDALLTDRDVQFYGCRVLNILAVGLNKVCEDDFDLQVTNACFLTGARVAVSKARRQHSTDLEVTQWADCAMRLL